MTRFYPFLAIGLLAVALAACNQQKSASEANRDTAQAQQDANKHVAEASKKASNTCSLAPLPRSRIRRVIVRLTMAIRAKHQRLYSLPIC